jgi:hypothetical protein
LIDTALREAHEEEINLAATMVRVMGSLLPVRSPAGFIVQPIVGIIGGDIFNDLQPDPAEVDSIFTVPLAHIGQPDNFSWCRAKPMGVIIVIGWSRILNIISGDYRRGC